ncbi:tRNA lysidine(34) synthetase [[Clostridium] colinum]|uniref:tRNA lysidine(34) synthetase n=1 Tax=[Clostridium] colinum TaxID=36835 RepID=UPI002ED5D7BA
MENKRLNEIERSIIKKYRKTIWRGFIKGIKKYDLIKENDKIAVCISGGKDSMLLAKLMQELQKHGKFHFEVKFIVMNPGYSKENMDKILENAKLLNIPINVFETSIFDIVIDIEDNPCYLCARMRRGHLYSKAKELGCNKIALGHHFDDVIETILMGIIYGGQVQTMMPKLHSLNFEGMELIRPMYMVREEDIIAWAKYHQLEFLRCGCRFTENIAYENKEQSGSTRQNIKNLIRKLRDDNPNIEKNIFNSVENINLSTIIGYHKDGNFYNFLDDYDNRVKKMGF